MVGPCLTMQCMSALSQNDRLRGPFIANAGQTDFPSDFPMVGQSAAVAVERNGERFEFSGAELAYRNVTDASFTVRLPQPLEAGDRVWLYSDIPAERTRAHQPNGAVRTETLEGDAESFQAQLQEVRRDIGHALRAPVGDPLAALPLPLHRAGKVLAFDADGQPRPTDFLKVVQDAGLIVNDGQWGPAAADRPSEDDATKRRALPRASSAALAGQVLFPAEVVWDTTHETLRLGDGETAGGHVVVMAKDAVRYGPKTVPVNNRVALLGDSITSSGIYNDADNLRDTARGMGFWLPTLTRQAFQTDQSLNFGVSGDTAAGALSRVQSVIDSGAGTCVVLIGTNDLGSPIEAVKGHLASIYKRLTDANILTIAMPLLPRTAPSTEAYGWMASLNRWIREQERVFPNLRVIDASPLFGDPYSLQNSPRQGFTYDGLHPMAIGARYMTQPVADYLLTLRKPLGRRVFTVTDHYWPGTNEGGYLNQNPMMAGVDGTVGAGITGQLANDWAISLSAGGGDLSAFSVEVSKSTNAATGLVAQKITYSGNLIGGWQTIIGMNDFGLTYQEHLKPGDKVIFEVDIDVPGGLPGVSGIVPFLMIEQGGVWKSAHAGFTWVSDDWTVDGFRGVLRTPPMTLTHALAAGENARADIWIYFKQAEFTGLAASFEIISAAVRKVV